MTDDVEEELPNDRGVQVRCGVCGWYWIVAYVPLEADTFCKILMSAHCPKCGAAAENILVFCDDPAALRGTAGDRESEPT